jgi:hypothetical protein
MVYYGQPTVWAPELEEKIVRQVRILAKSSAGTPEAGNSR